jgi:hypothetical protein
MEIDNTGRWVFYALQIIVQAATYKVWLQRLETNIHLSLQFWCLSCFYVELLAWFQINATYFLWGSTYAKYLGTTEETGSIVQRPSVSWDNKGDAGPYLSSRGGRGRMCTPGTTVVRVTSPALEARQLVWSWAWARYWWWLIIQNVSLCPKFKYLSWK